MRIIQADDLHEYVAAWALAPADFSVEKWLEEQGITSGALLAVTAHLSATSRAMLGGPVAAQSTLDGCLLAAFSAGWEAHKHFRGEQQ